MNITSISYFVFKNGSLRPILELQHRAGMVIPRVGEIVASQTKDYVVTKVRYDIGMGAVYVEVANIPTDENYRPRA